MSCFKLLVIFFRSEQDREPELEAVSEVAGPSNVEESVADRMYFIVNFRLHKFLTFLNKANLILLACISVLSALLEIDEYELVDPVDILTPLEKSEFWDGVVNIVLVSDIILTNCITYLFIFF